MSLPAGAALGSTEDPKALIVGDASTVDSQADALRREAKKMQSVSRDLKAVRTPTWTGAASASFWAGFGSEPRVWADLRDLMTKAAGALDDHAGALRHAQQRAQDAIDKWNRGEAATQTAVTEYNAESKSRAESAPIPGLFLPMPPFHDPGESMRAEARQILTDARNTLDEAGLEATSSLCELGGISWSEASGDLSGPGVDGSVEGPKFTYGDDAMFAGGPRPWKKDDGDRSAKPELSLGEISGSAYLAQASGQVAGNYHGIDYDASGEIHLGADAHAGAAITDSSLKATAGASLGVSTQGEAHADYGYLGVGAEGTAMAGALAEGELEIGTEGVHAGGEAFVGGQAEGSLSGDVGGVGGSVTGEAWAGIGASADLDAGYEDGVFTIGGHLGAGLSIGGQLGGNIEIDVGEVLDTGKDIIDGIGGLFD